MTGFKIFVVGFTVCLCLPARAVPYFAPTGSRSYVLNLDDGNRERFVVDADNPDLLAGENHAGEIDGDHVLVLDESQRNGYQFEDGRAIAALEDGIERLYPKFELAASPSAFEALYEEDEYARQIRKIPDIWQGRFRLWFANPNTAAILTTELALLALAALFAKRKTLAIGAAIALPVLLYAIVATSSRGAILALASGIAALFLDKARFLLKPKALLSALGVVLILVAAICLSGKADRYTAGFFKQDESTSRTTIWMSVPRMMADSPGGWGWGKSGEAYVKWYQPENTCLLKDMIGSHFTDLVETGWIGRFALIFLWTLLIVGTIDAKKPLAAALWTAFAVGGFFNPATRFGELWVLPLAFTIPAVRKFRRRDGIIAACVASLVIAVFAVLGAYGKSDVRVHAVKGGAIVNSSSAATWIVDDDWTLHGGYWWLFAREVRDYYRAHPDSEPVGIVDSIDRVPADAKKIVIVGRNAAPSISSGKLSASAAELVFLSPGVSASEIASAIAPKRARIIMGEFAARLSGDYGRPVDGLEIVKGAERYIPDWLARVLEASRLSGNAAGRL